MIQLVLSHKSIDRIHSHCISLPVFVDQRPLCRQSALVDWRLNGRISHLLEQNKMSGEPGDSLLMPTGGRIQASTLLLYGFGSWASWSPDSAEGLFTSWIEKLQKLNFDYWLLSFSELADDFLSWRHCMRSFVNLLAHDPHSYRRKLFLSENPKWVLEAKRRNMDFGVEVQLAFDLAETN